MLDKCDEALPACSFCAQRSFDCQYLSPARRKAAGVRSLELKAPDQSKSLQASAPVSYFHDPFDMQLLQYWTLYVSRTLSQEQTDLILWRHRTPSMAFACPFVMHALLAVSALALARDPNAEKTKCFRRAEVHHSQTLSRMVVELNHVDRKNADALFVAATLLSFYHFAAGPQLGQYLVCSEYSTPDWLGLLGGVRSILETLPDGAMQDHSLIHQHETPCNCELLGRPPRIAPVSYENALARLRSVINAKMQTESRLATIHIAMNQLEWCFDNALVDDGHPDGMLPRNHLVMAWLYMLEPAFILIMQQKDPVALIVLAHFAVSLHQIRFCWLMQGWSVHLMSGIRKYVPESLKASLQWPLQILGLPSDVC